MTNQWLEKVNHALWMYDHEGWDVRKVAEELAPTPPADDVREALADESDFTPSTEQVRSHYVFDQSNVWRPERGRAFDRWLATQVRPRGTVTDTAVETAWRVYEGIAPETFVMGHYIGKARKRMRAALEAAREVRPYGTVTDDQVAAGLDARAMISRTHFYLYSTEKCKCGENYTDAHTMRLLLEYVSRNA